MDFGLSFGYVFKDEDWFRKIAIPALCSLIPVIGQFIVVGWGIQVARNVIDGKERVLPELEFGPQLGRGFIASVIALIYSLPVAIIVGVSGFMVGFATDQSGSANWLLVVLGSCVGLLGLLVGLVSAVMTAPAVANYAAKGDFGAAFKFKEIIAMLKKSFVSWLLVVLGQIIALGFIAPLGTIACFIGALLTFVYGTAVYYHLMGQAYNQSAVPTIEEIETI